MHILIAPNSYKNSLGAKEAAAAIEQGLLESRLQCTTECFPVADGGDGTASLLTETLQATTLHAKVHDPLMRPVSAPFGFISDSKTAIIELAAASGLRLLGPDEYDPLHATTFGTGELISHALDKGAEKIVLGIGGSATVDGGTGILRALGVRFHDEEGSELTRLPADLMRLSFVDTSGIDQRIGSTELTILCDVKNFLLGPQGASAVFGPQKGANEAVVAELERLLSRWWDVSLLETGKDMSVVEYGGAAGGVAAGLSAYLDAQLVNGIQYFLDRTGFTSALAKADIVITGEGHIDEQTLEGKGPFGVALLARQQQIPVIALSGNVPLRVSEPLQKYFDVLININHTVSSTTYLDDTRQNLIRTATQIGNLLAI